MQRTLLLAPIAFVALAALGFHNVVAQWLAPSPVVPAPRGGAALVAPAAAAAPTQAIATLIAVATTEPTSAPSPTAPLRLDAAIVPNATVGWSPTPLAPTATPQPTATATPHPALAILNTSSPPHRTGSDPPPRIGAKEFIVVDDDSGAILAEQNAHRHVAPASTTKIITALVALQHNDPSEMVTAQFDQTELVDSTLMGLRIGDRLTLEDLLYGLMLPSGNDAALAIANHVAGSKAAFVQMMNDLATDLGLTDSHFVNPHGLDNPNHYSSAYDMVQFARAGMRDPRFRALAAARSHTEHIGSRTYDIYNLNKVLAQVPGADGVKIGYTEDAGRTIVASATRNGHRIFVGAFHSSDLVADSRPLIEWAFKNFSWALPTGSA